MARKEIVYLHLRLNAEVKQKPPCRKRLFHCKEVRMVKLFRFDETKRDWVFADYGVKSKVSQYTKQGFIVVHDMPQKKELQPQKPTNEGGDRKWRAF
jgi:hypothetical protein